MYAECGLLMEAREVLDEMHMRDIFAWNVLCLGYADAGLDFEALQCLHLSKMEGLSPNSHTFVVALKICGKANFLEKGKELHSEITLKGLEQDSFVGSALLDMYARCGLLLEAEKVFEGLGEKDVVAWTAMISHYLENDQAISGLECFQKMQSKGVLPNPVTYMSALKACMCLGSLTMGQQLHSDLTEKGFENDVLVGGALVNMYAKHGWLAEAYAVFEKLPRKETNSLIALLSGYVEHGFDDKVFNISEGMQKHGVSLDPIVYVLTVEACTNARAFHKGLNIHCEIIKEEFESSNVVNSVLMDMYAKCGFLAESLEVFDDAPTQDVFLWTTRMTCLLEREHYKEALMCLEEMQKDGVSPNSVTYICALQACAHLQVMDMGRSVHAKITAAGFDEDLVVGNVLVDFYIKCGSIPESWEVFNQLHNKDIASWNTLIAGFIEFEVAQDVPTYLSRMQQDGISPNKITFLYLLKASSIIESKEEGRRAHTEVVKLGYDGDLLVDNTLVDVYTKLGSFSEAYDIFDKMVFRNVVSWNIMIAGCAERQLGREGLECLEQMSVDGVAPNISTLVCGLNCCTTIGALKAGQALYSNIIKIGFEIDAIVGSALIDMYACCGQLVDAQEVFAHLQIKNDAWSAIISGYEKHGQNEKALACFEDMLAQGVSLDNVTFASILRICGSVGAVVKGQEAHMMVTRAGREDDPLIATMLIDMYSRCGCLTDAYDLFEVLIDKDIVAWSALIAGFARYGECQKVIYLVGKMESSSLLLDAVALLSILTACSHVGLIDLGQSYFQANAESSVFSVREEHYNCMIDLLSRAGHLEMALLMILEMPWEPDTLTWSIIVGACRNWENSDLGYDIFQLTF
ncbi:hypothetical protein KP509_05G086700 [Ceratopteris richardii]|nr:hypothetical protein KP509_05G086700 [Ceratopteris richardii]